MPLIASVVAELTVRPLPVLCVDTCDVLDVIQSVTEGTKGHPESGTKLLQAASGPSPTVLLVASFLVPIEFNQRVGELVSQAERAIQDADDRLEFLIGAATEVALAPPVPVRLSALGLPAQLRAIAERVIAASRVLDRDQTCVDRAIDRVVQKVRPSHRGAIKDSIHLELYMEFARQARLAGVTSKFAFASANKADFCKAKGKPDPHGDPEAECLTAGLQYFGSWQSACGWLGI